MAESGNSIVADKSKAFAIRVVGMARYLQKEKGEFVLSKQVLKSGTSIGANVRESKNAESKLDFVHKLEIALKESDETEYWLDILYETNYIPQSIYDSMLTDNKELTALLTSIIKTSKSSINK